MATSTSTTITTGVKRCKPFLLRVMVFSPETGYKFTIEVQKACTAQNEEVWKLLFDLYKKINNEFVEVVSVEFVAGDPNEIEKVAAITDQGMTRPQVRAFRDNVFPLVKPFADSGNKPTAADKKKIDDTMRNAIMGG
ncbi:MAG: hypothetical protein ICV53_18730 [Flavisolibacter sp.]|nr:hypothetical protein [Flavisolibacter sp.]MBD0368124.1 hypothetical protein [Flavisolibacter sp.]